MAEFTARATEVDRVEPIQLAVSDMSGTRWHYMTKDQAVHLANQMLDAVDELELAEAVSGE